jgi:hypothetical protein
LIRISHLHHLSPLHHTTSANLPTTHLVPHTAHSPPLPFLSTAHPSSTPPESTPATPLRTHPPHTAPSTSHHAIPSPSFSHWSCPSCALRQVPWHLPQQRNMPPPIHLLSTTAIATQPTQSTNPLLAHPLSPHHITAITTPPVPYHHPNYLTSTTTSHRYQHPQTRPRPRSHPPPLNLTPPLSLGHTLQLDPTPHLSLQTPIGPHGGDKRLLRSRPYFFGCCRRRLQSSKGFAR